MFFLVVLVCTALLGGHLVDGPMAWIWTPLSNVLSLFRGSLSIGQKFPDLITSVDPETEDAEDCLVNEEL